MINEVEFPLDADGFLRRECPSCEQVFKWHHGKTDDAPEDFEYPGNYWCPRCGQPAGPESWWTPEQLDYLELVQNVAVHDAVSEAMGGFSKPRRNSAIRIEVTTSPRPGMPDPLVEPDDMDVIAPPCHAWEPVKVPEESEPPYFCLVCGTEYRA